MRRFRSGINATKCVAIFKESGTTKRFWRSLFTSSNSSFESGNGAKMEAYGHSLHHDSVYDPTSLESRLLDRDSGARARLASTSLRVFLFHSSSWKDACRKVLVAFETLLWTFGVA